MADSIPSPWILEYCISVAEEYGGNLSSVPWREKGGKAQLVKVSTSASFVVLILLLTEEAAYSVQFLTFPPEGSNEPCALWVEISDKKHIIHARLTFDAVQKHYQYVSALYFTLVDRKLSLIGTRRTSDNPLHLASLPSSF